MVVVVVAVVVVVVVAVVVVVVVVVNLTQVVWQPPAQVRLGFPPRSLPGPIQGYYSYLPGAHG